MKAVAKTRWDSAVYAALAIASAFLILRFPQEVRFDQNFILFRLSHGSYPSFDSGVFSNLLASFLNTLLDAQPERLNAVFKTIAMLFFTGSAFVLARAALTRPATVALFCLFVFTSRIPFLWLSTELLAGGFLCLAILSIWKQWPMWLAGALCALLAFIKPDLILVSFALLAWIWFSKSSSFISAVLGFSAVFLGFMLPGFFFRDAPFFGSRAFGAFCQHYAALLERHQAALPAPDPWRYPEAYSASVFPLAKSMKDVVIRYPSLYADYLALSLLHGMKSFLRLFHFLLLLVPVRLILIRREVLPLMHFEKIALVTLLGLAPHFAFSFPHVRYLVRYYPALLIAFLAVAEELFLRKARVKTRKPELYWLSSTLVFLILVAGLAWQTGILGRDFSRISSASQYWFPD